MTEFQDVLKKLELNDEWFLPFGRDKAKIRLEAWKELEKRPQGRLVLVSAISPSPAGEGKTTTTIGVADGLRRIGTKALATLRQPSMGPVFGMKGGATGAGKARVMPDTDINLHFTGDFHAITTAHNLLSATLDNHLHFGNALDIDVRRIVWRRVIDMNDRALRHVNVGLGGSTGGVPREDLFDITAASEVMAIVALSSSYEELKERLAKIVVAYKKDGTAVRAADLHVVGAMAAVLRDALLPNVVRTLEGTPVLMHCGPFANIAHGCNSVLATRFALRMADVVLSEAGFGFDMGGEKFLDIFCPVGGFKPSAAIIVATVRGLKFHGGCPEKELTKENLKALEQGFLNLEHHLSTLEKYGVPAIVAMNVFTSDTEAELSLLERKLKEKNIPGARCNIFADGGKGAEEVSRQLLQTLEERPSRYRPLQDGSLSLEQKIETVAQEVYGADGVDFMGNSRKQLKDYAKIGYADAPICMAKTQYSLSDDAKKVGRPTGFRIQIREVRLMGGANLVTPLTGEIMTMPGLPKVPSAEAIDLTSDGRILMSKP